MNTFISLIILSFLIETLWERVKDIFLKNSSDELKKTINLTGTSVLGVLLAVITDMDIFLVLGFVERFHFAGVFLTGILAGGGSNYVHALMKKLQNFRK